MAYHRELAIGSSVSGIFNRLYCRERAAETYVHARQVGPMLRILSDETAAKMALELEDYPDQSERRLSELEAWLDDEGSNKAYNTHPE